MAGCSLLIKGGYFPNFQRWDPFHLILPENNAIVLIPLNINLGKLLPGKDVSA